MSVDLTLLKKLREALGAGLGDCKKALIETENNFDDAVNWLRKKGIASAAKKSGRVASEGLVGINIQENSGIVLELNSETDFVAKNENFQSILKQLLEIGINADSLEELNELKIANITVAEKIAESSGIIGEKMDLRRFQKVTVTNGVVAYYIHASEIANMGKTCVLLGVESKSTNKEALFNLGKKICMQAAAMNPQYLKVEDVPSTIVQNEKEIAKAQLIAQKKPENVIERILEGKITKYYEDNVLLNQIFVMDNKKTISDVIKEEEKALGETISFTT
ncbi:MAG: elongation factor Ts, partial [Candidatus Deianiraeaceae bacterium]